MTSHTFLLEFGEICGIFRSMTTITLDKDPNFERNRFKDAEELLAYLTSQVAGFLYEGDSELNLELDQRIQEMDKNPSSIISAGDAIKFARTGK